MRWTLPLTLAAVLLSAPAGAAPKQTPSHDPRTKPPATKSYKSSRPTAPARLGVQAEPMTEELRGYFGAPADAGVLVSRVLPDTPASRAKVLVGDVIIRVDKNAIDDVTDVRNALRNKKKGDTTQLTVVRDKKVTVLTVRVDTASPEMKPLEELRRDIERHFEEMQKRLEQKDKA